MNASAARIWEETLMNEQRQQSKDWAARNVGMDNPLDFKQNPLPPRKASSDPAQAPISLPRNAPVDTKNPFQIRCPRFVIPGDPAAKPKFYAGRRDRRGSQDLPGVTAKSIPGITSGLGGYRALPIAAQEQLVMYPPPNPLAKKSQSTPGTSLPGSTTFGFGYNFDRASRDSTTGAKPNFRPARLAGETRSFCL